MYVGMNRRKEEFLRYCPRVPHVRGDEPLVGLRLARR